MVIVEIVKLGMWIEELWFKNGEKFEVEKFYLVILEFGCGVVNEVEWRKRIWKMKIFVIENLR